MSTPIKALLCGFALAVSGCGLTGTALTPLAPAQQAPKPAASPTPAPAAGTAIPFDRFEILRPDADPEKPLPRTEHLRLRSQAALEAFLAELQAEAGTRMKVDFTRQEVLAFHEAGGSSGCADRTLRSLTATPGAIQAVYGSENELDPDPDRACTEVFLFPGYDLYTMPRSDKPVEGVKDYEPGRAAAFRPLLDGPHSNAESFQTVTLRSQSELDVLWKQMGEQAQPSIDFSEEMVIGGFLGTRSSGGYQVAIKEVDGLKVTYEESVPSGPASMALTQPFVLVAAPRRDGEVVFKKRAS